MKAEIISIGTELLLGEITDTNTPFMAGELATLGIDLYHACTVGDNCDRLLEVLQQAWKRSELIITTGGLGPTQDDVTREAIAGLLGEEVYVDEGLKSYITEFFARRGLEMPDSNIRQAALVPSARAMMNPLGTAPGWWVEKGGRIVAALPGPPGEMQTMWRSEVFPRLESRSGAIILSRTVKTWGLSEAKVDEVIAPLLSTSNPTLAVYAKPDGIYLRITAKADKEDIARELISERETRIREMLSEHIWGIDDDTLEGIAGRLLMEKGLTLAVAERYTGGFLSYMLSSANQSADFYKGGIVIGGDYSRAILGIEPKTISEETGPEVVASMASLARAEMDADVGVGIDGFLEQAGNIMTGRIFFAISTELDKQSITQSYPGGPQRIVRRAVYHALFHLQRVLRSG